MMEGSTWRIIGAMVQLLLLISMISCSPARQQQEREGQHRVSRRNSNLASEAYTPLHYKLWFTPDVEAATFQGNVQITFVSKFEAETVTLHADEELVVTQMNLDAVDSSNLQSIDIVGKSRDADKEWIVITLAKKLEIGVNYQLTLNYNGKLRGEQAEGFIRGSYECTTTNDTRWFAGTQMPNRKARSVFPCFDDPMFKTPFEVSVARKEGYNTLSNTWLRASEPDPDDATLVWDHFVATPPISTFSVGVIVSDCVSVTTPKILNSNVTLQVFGRPGTEIQLQTTANLAQEMLTKIENYLGMSYPFSKLDIVVSPIHTSARLVDYAGVLIFAESELVDKQAEYSLGIQLARQWFVHMSSPVSWNAVVDASALGTFVDIASGAFVAPWAFRSGWPQVYYLQMQVPGWPGHSSKTALGIWILEMLNHTLSEETFKKGLHNFLEERKYNSYTVDDLWKALDSTATNKGTSLSISQILRPWLEFKMLPVVTVTRNYEARTANLEQRALNKMDSDNVTSDYNSWTLPIMYFTEENQNTSSQSPVTWMNDKEITVTDMPEADKFIVVNPKGIGIYLVNYDQHNWAMIAQYLAEDPTRIDEATRYNLLHDAWTLGDLGALHFHSVLNMTLFLYKETSLSVWTNFNRMYLNLATRLDGAQANKKFKEYTTLVMMNLLESLPEPTPEEDEETAEVRYLANTMLSELSNVTYEANAVTYRQWIEDMDPSEDIDERNSTAICTLISWGSNEEWDLCINKLLNSASTANPSWQQSFLSCFTMCSRQDEHFQRLLNVVFFENAELFTDTNKKTLMYEVPQTYGGNRNMLTFLTENWDAVKHSLENKPGLWKLLVVESTEHVKTQEDLDKVVALYEARKEELGDLKENFDYAIAKAKKEIEWGNHNNPVIEAWLDNKISQMRD